MLRKGHLGYNLYFIYSGAVSVVLDKDDGNVFVKPEVVVLRKGACFGVSVFTFLWLVHTAWDWERDRDTDGHNRKQWIPVPVPV